MGVHVFAKIIVQLRLSVTEHRRVFIVRREICQIGQCGEDRHLRELRNARDHEEADVPRAILHLAVEVSQYSAHRLRLVRLVQQLRHRVVILVDENDDALPVVGGGERINGVAEIGGGRLACIILSAGLQDGRLHGAGEGAAELIQRRHRREPEVEIQHRPRLPFPIRLSNGQPVEQLLPPFEDGLQRPDHQRLAKTARTCQKVTVAVPCD